MTGQDRDQIRRQRDADARRRLAEDGDPIIQKETTMASATAKRPRATAAAETTTDGPTGPELETALLAAAKKVVKGVERVDAKSGDYFRLRLGTATLAYVNPSKKGLILNLATPKDKVPAGVKVKPGPNAARPVKFRVDAAGDVEVAAKLLAIAAKTEPAKVEPAKATAAAA